MECLVRDSNSATGDARLCAVVIDCDEATGKARLDRTGAHVVIESLSLSYVANELLQALTRISFFPRADPTIETKGTRVLMGYALRAERNVKNHDRCGG